MKFRTLASIPLTILFSCLCAATSVTTAAEIPDGVWVRDGYRLSIAVDGITTPRFLAYGPENRLFVSVLKQGMIMLCEDSDGDGRHEKLTPFVEGKDPRSYLQGMQWHDGWLWFAQLNAISKARDTDGDGKADEIVEVLGEDQLPTGARGGHMWRALLIHNGRVYTHVGDQTNATDEPIDASERKKLWSFELDGSDKKLFATGLRNTEKFAVRPGTDEIWGVDHDIDQFAWALEGDRTKNGQPITDHNPPAELNHYVEGGFYGHPWIVGKNQPNLNFLDHPKLIEYAGMATIPEWLMPAHCSANALIFYTGDQIPDARGDVFVAQRGGWNATSKVGYCLSRILFENGHPYGELKMVSFLKGDEVLGRPADCAEAPDGSILISDDTGNKVYRLSYVGNASR